MLPVYEAIEFKRIMEGGSTRPWLVTVLKEGEPVPYVVKLYNEKDNEDDCTVLKECICSHLAKEFDLKTPQPALIEFTPAFLNGLTDENKEIIKRKDSRLKFGTALIESPYANYSPALQIEYLKTFDIASIYAFDNLILNIDRRNEKPNILFKDGDGILIDHELTLVLAQNARDSILNKSQWPHNYKRHLFYSILKDAEERSELKDGFDTFSYYLSKLVNFGVLDTIVSQLEENEHPVIAYGQIKHYFLAAQQHCDKFIELLLDSLK